VTDVVYEQETEPWELELAALLATLWGRVGSGLTFSQFITEAADSIIAYREIAWTLGDVDLANGIARATALPIEPLGYRPLPYFLDAAVLEQQLVRVLYNVGSEELRVASRLADETARTAVDELRAKRLERLGSAEVNDTWRASQGTAVNIWSRAGMVEGFKREAAPDACPWCRSLANGVWPADAVFATHPNDRCRRTPVTVPIDQIQERWRDGYAQRLGRRIAQEPTTSTFSRWEYDTTLAA
jgi:hypothetical protein